MCKSLTVSDDNNPSYIHYIFLELQYANLVVLPTRILVTRVMLKRFIYVPCAHNLESLRATGFQVLLNSRMLLDLVAGSRNLRVFR